MNQKILFAKQHYIIVLDEKGSKSIEGDFSSKAEQLTEVGINILDNLLSIMLLGSSPEDFKYFIVAIESRDEIPSVSTKAV